MSYVVPGSKLSNYLSRVKHFNLQVNQILCKPSIAMASDIETMDYRQLALRFILSEDDAERINVSFTAAQSRFSPTILGNELGLHS